jgi:mono/diheme cytochrome c family protein
MKHLRLFIILSSLSLASADEKAEAIAHGKTKFMTCAACHGQDGKGLMLGPTQMMAPGYKGSSVVDGDPELFALILLKGIKKEDQKYLGVMAPLGGALNDKDLAGIMTYIRNDFSEKKDLVTEKQVAAWRQKYQDRNEQVSRKEIENFLTKETPKEEKEVEKE